MRDPKRIDTVLNKLAVLWRANPDMRLGQLIENIARPDTVTFQIEDDALTSRMNHIITSGWNCAGEGEATNDSLLVRISALESKMEELRQDVWKLKHGRRP